MHNPRIYTYGIQGNPQNSRSEYVNFEIYPSIEILIKWGVLTFQAVSKIFNRCALIGMEWRAMGRVCLLN